MAQREFIHYASFIACVLTACSSGDAPVALRPNAPGSLRANVGGFSCALTYDAITQTDETELQPYGVEPVTDTARICETWTGSDYNAEITQVGSSEPASDYSEDMPTVVYQSGGTTPYDGSAGQMEAASGVGANSFEFVAATSDEQQASYNDPYYAVVADPDPVHCSNPPCAAQNIVVGAGSRSVDVPAPLRRLVLKYLLNGATEILPSVEGFRRFRKSYPTGEEVTISIDPVTELIRRQEVTAQSTTTRADLTWSLQNGKFVREQMEITGEDAVGSKRYTSHTLVLLRNVHWDPNVIR